MSSRPAAASSASTPLAAELGADLGAQLFAVGELDVEGESLDPHALRALGTQAHLDPFVGRVPDRDVRERVGIEVGVELAVHDPQHVAVEVGGHARGVVVRGDEPVGALHEIGAEEEGVAGLEAAGDVGEERRARLGREIADGAAEEGDDARAVARDAVEVVLEVADDGVDLDTVVLRGDRRRGRARGSPR